MDFSGYVGAMTAMNAMDSHDDSNKHYKDTNVERVKEDRMTDGVKEVVHSPGVHGVLKYTHGSFVVPSGKWEVSNEQE